jgi:nitroimidazol reductase NimA-like FMN-containing flavoprotein (pyridoxamine 5'-phosphate oxidase superfamily)
MDYKKFSRMALERMPFAIIIAFNNRKRRNFPLVNEKLNVTDKTKLRRVPKRAAYDVDTIYKILDEGFIAHVGFTVDEQTFVIPTSYGRDGNKFLIHGSAASRMLRAMASEIDVCATVTLIDGLVLARSAFHHSMNYRSVVIFGTAKVIQDEAEKFHALQTITEHIVPNRWRDVRMPNEKELKATMVLSLPIEEASAKIRTGNPVDDAEDYAMEVWAGVIPLKTAAGRPVADSVLKAEIKIPDYVENYRR